MVLTNSTSPVGTSGTVMAPQVHPSLGQNAQAFIESLMPSAVIGGDQSRGRCYFGPGGILPWSRPDPSPPS